MMELKWRKIPSLDCLHSRDMEKREGMWNQGKPILLCVSYVLSQLSYSGTNATYLKIAWRFIAIPVSSLLSSNPECDNENELNIHVDTT